MVDQIRAADLRGGSVVVDDLKGVAFYAVADPGEEPGGRWEMSLSPCMDSTVDYHLRHGAQVVRVGDDQATELERYRTEARNSAEDAGRRMRLIVRMHAALCGTPQTPEVLAALDAVDAEARRSPWIAERVSGDVTAADGHG